MTKTLDEKIEARKQQAAERKIFAKGSIVAEKLGKVDYLTSSLSKDQKVLTHVFSDAAAPLVVKHKRVEDYSYSSVDGYAESTSRHVTISFKGSEVFSAGGYGASNVYAYVPGAWEKALDFLQPAAQQEVKKEQDADAQKISRKKAAEEAAKRKQWGL